MASRHCAIATVLASKKRTSSRSLRANEYETSLKTSGRHRLPNRRECREEQVARTLAPEWTRFCWKPSRLRVLRYTVRTRPLGISGYACLMPAV